VPSTRKITVTLRVQPVIRRGSLDTRLWPRRGTTMQLRSATAATTWSHHLLCVGTTSPVGRLPRQLSPTSRSKTAAPTPTFGCRPITSPSRQPTVASTTWRPTSRW
jgi:hypothetical protein